MTARDDGLNGHQLNGHTDPLLPGLVSAKPAHRRGARKVRIVVDIGSGNLKSAGYSQNAAGEWVHLPDYRRKAKTLLARDTGKDEVKISETALRAAVAELDLIVPYLDLLPDEDVRIYVTSWARRLEGTEAGERIMDILRQAAGGRHIRILTGEEEAEYIRRALVDERERLKNALKRSPSTKSVAKDKPEAGLAKQKKATRAAGRIKAVTETAQDEKTDIEMFAALGGGSGQFGLVDDDDGSSLRSIPYIGIQPLIHDSGGNLERAAENLHEAIAAIDYGNVDVLRAAGGVWRDVAKVIERRTKTKRGEGLFQLNFQQASEELTAVMKMEPGEFVNMNDHTPQELAFGAMALLEIMKHFKAEKLVFSMATTRSSIAKDDRFNDKPKVAEKLPSFAAAAIARAQRSHSGVYQKAEPV